NAIMMVFLEGPETCCQCHIDCFFTPKFKARVTVDPPAKAVAAGAIDVVSASCGAHAIAAGGAQAGDDTPVKIKFTTGASVSQKDGPSVSVGLEVEMTVTGEDVNEQAFIGNANGSVDICSVELAVVPNAKLDVMADANVFN